MAPSKTSPHTKVKGEICVYSTAILEELHRICYYCCYSYNLFLKKYAKEQSLDNNPLLGRCMFKI